MVDNGKDRHGKPVTFRKMKAVLAIAGSDSSGGAGIEADIKSITMQGVFAMTAITALTAQNTEGVRAIHPVPTDFLAEAIDAVFDDIPPDAVKIGMVGDADHIRTIARKLSERKAENIVVDPVMVATSGARLMEDGTTQTLKESFFPLATLLTPNVPEAEILSGRAIRSAADMEEAAAALYRESGTAILLKGGHAVEDADDVLDDGDGIHRLRGTRIDNPNTHGTGCTLSSAIAAHLALGEPLLQAVQSAKTYLTGAIAYGLDLGHGHGPMNHAYLLERDKD